MLRAVILDDVSDIDEMGLWSGASDRWEEATEEQKNAVYERLVENQLAECEFVSETTINDFIWFDCDDIFFPEESEEQTSEKPWDCSKHFE